MAEHNVNTVKAQIQSLINKANETTGNNDTNLTDGVNALVSGFKPSGTLEGLANGYDVMFYDENNEGLAFYSIKSGHSINPPVYNCKAWQTSDGTNVVFPYTPSADAIFYALNSNYADQLYEYYGVDKGEYPYVYVSYGYNSGWSNKYELRVIFCKSVNGTKTSTNYWNNKASNSAIITDFSNMEQTLSEVMSNISNTSTFKTYANFTMTDTNGSADWYKYYTNFDVSLANAPLYRLDE